MKFSFSENVTVKNIDIVPEDFRALYVKKDDGTFTLDTSDAKVKSAVAAITGLNQALVTSRAEAEAAKKGKVDLSSLADYGDTPEKIAEGITAKIKALTDGGKVNVDKIRQEIAASFAKDHESKDKRIGALSAQLHKILVDNGATAAIADAKGVVDLLLPMIRNNIRVAEKDGQFHVNVVDAQNEIRYSGVTGQPMTIKELVAEMKGNTAFGGAFQSEALGGGGTKPGSTTTPAGGTNTMPKASDSVSKIARGLTALQPRRAGAGA